MAVDRVRRSRDAGRTVTMDDVAAAAGVSRSLVSLVMRGSERPSAASRAAVLAAAERLGYRRNLAASRLAALRTMTIGLLLDDLHNPWYAELADGAHDTAEKAGYHLLLATGLRSAAVESQAVDTFLASQVDAILVAGCRLPLERLETVAAEVPVVSAGRSLTGAMLGSVSADDAEGARLAVQHLHSLGHRRIAHVDGGKGAGAATRRAGYVSAMRAAGLGDHVQVIPGDFTEKAGERAAQRTLGRPDRPTAYFTANDLVAVGVIDAADRHGLAVPGDVSVVGYDNTALAALGHVDLTTVAQPNAEMGRVAVEMLLGALDGRPLVHRAMRPRLVVRGTTGPA